jgi:hypothetical protein
VKILKEERGSKKKQPGWNQAAVSIIMQVVFKILVDPLFHNRGSYLLCPSEGNIRIFQKIIFEVFIPGYFLII